MKYRCWASKVAPVQPGVALEQETRSTTTRDRLICNFGVLSPLDFLEFSLPLFSSFLCSLVRKSTQNVEKIARFPGGEKNAYNPVTSLAVMVFSVLPYRARDIFGTLRPSPEKTTCSLPCRSSGDPGMRALYQAIGIPRLGQEIGAERKVPEFIDFSTWINSAMPQQSEICVKFPFFTPFLVWNFGEVFFFLGHPSPGKRSTDNFTNISRQISGREKRRKISLPHFCRVAALRIMHPRFFALCFPGKGDYWKVFLNLCRCSRPNPQTNSIKKSHKFFWVACWQNETTPENAWIQYEKGLKNATKDLKNDPKRGRKVFSPSLAA